MDYALPHAVQMPEEIDVRFVEVCRDSARSAPAAATQRGRRCDGAHEPGSGGVLCVMALAVTEAIAQAAQ